MQWFSMKYAIAFCMSLFVSPSYAAEPMSASEFDAYTRGKTLFYGQDGQAYGAEQYLPNRRVIWSFLDGQCQYGTWYQQDEQICFEYENGSGPQCWTFRKGSAGLIAEFEDSTSLPELYEAQDLDEEMLCLGPEVGV